MLAAILSGSAVFLVYAWWVQHPPGLMSGDESAHALLALRVWRVLEDPTVSIADVLTSSVSAPLVPIVGAPLAALDPLGHPAVLVQIPFVWLLVIAAFAIYRRVSSRRAAMIGTVTTALVPGILTYSRSLYFAVPVAAILTAAMAALLASRGLTSWRWALAFGILLGLAPLTRTVAIALMPGLVLAALVTAVGRSSPRTWVPNFMLALAAAAVIAGLWYIPSFAAVFDYLVAAGLREDSPFNVDYPGWQLRLIQLVGHDFLVPLSMIGIGLFVAAALRRSLSFGSRDMASIAVAAACYFGVLAASRNGGTAFTLPLIPLIVALALVLARVSGRRVAAVAAVAALSVSLLNLGAAIVPVGRVGIGQFGIIDGRSVTQGSIAGALGDVDAPVADAARLGVILQRVNCGIAARGDLGAILMARPDALVSGVALCADAIYRSEPFIGALGCSPASVQCVAEVVGPGGFPTIVTGKSRAPYPGFVREAIMRRAMTDYRIGEEFIIAPGVEIRMWVR